MVDTATDWYPHISYKKFVRSVKRSQIILSIILGIFISTIPEIREQIQKKPVQYIIVSMSFEVIMFATVSWIFGMSRVPANYISLIFLRFYVFFDCQYWNRVEKVVVERPLPKIVTPPEPWYKIIWHKSFGYFFYHKDAQQALAMSTGSQVQVPECCGGGGGLSDNNSSLYWSIYIEKIVFAILMVVVIALVTIFSKIDISRCEWLALSFISIGTSLSTIILITSMAIDVLGRDFHCSLCVTWTFISLVAALFTFVFATQRLYKRVSGSISSSQRFYRTQAELIIFAINVCVAVYYIPLIHPEFSFGLIINSFPAKLGNIIPEPVHQYTHSLIQETKTVASGWLPQK